MCAVSNIGDQYSQQWQNHPINIPNQIGGMGGQIHIGPTKYEFDELKREVWEMKKLLLEAKELDRKNREPDCEMESKIKILKAVADAVGVSLDDVFKKGQ